MISYNTVGTSEPFLSQWQTRQKQSAFRLDI